MFLLCFLTKRVPPPSGQLYYVQQGDTLRKIAAKFSTTLDAILKLNPQITNPNLIYVGQAVSIPADVSTYLVQKVIRSGSLPATSELLLMLC